MREFEDIREKEDKVSLKRVASSFIWDTVKIIAISFAIIVPIRYYVVQPFFVKGESMRPAFENNDYVLIDEISYRFKEPKRGEVIVFRFPENPSQFFIKRIVGLPGDTVDIRDNKVYIFNEQNLEGLILDESSYLPENQKFSGNTRLELKEDEFFVLGDNRLQSSDSRRWGALSGDLVVGRAFVRLWPFDKFEKFNYPSY